MPLSERFDRGTLAVPDNTKTAVTRACRYDPDLSPIYQEFAVSCAEVSCSALLLLTKFHEFKSIYKGLGSVLIKFRTLPGLAWRRRAPYDDVQCPIGPNCVGSLLLYALAPSCSPQLLPQAQGCSLRFSSHSPCLPWW